MISVAALQARAAGPSPTPIRIRTEIPERSDRDATPTGPPFGDTLRQAVGQVDAAQKTADAQVEAFVAGETENTHEVMISLNQAQLHFQLLTEVRNKLLDGYQELMRMQV